MVMIYSCLDAQSFSLPNPHYFHNRYALNPSLAGSLGYTYLAVNYRKQNIGDLPGTPQHLFAALDIPFRYRRHNLGIQAYGRKAGLFSNTFFAAHYALQVMPSPNQRIRFGLGGGMKFSMLDTKSVDPNDPVVQSWKNKTDPLLQAGISYNAGNFWIGASLQDILYKEPATNGKTASSAPFRHYNAFLSYKFIANDDLFFETALLHRSKEYEQSSVELNATGMLQNKYWLALSYRNDIGATVMAGFKVSGFLSTALGYKTGDFFNRKNSTYISNPAIDVLLGFHFGNEETAKEEWIDRNDDELLPKAKDTVRKSLPKQDTTSKVAVRNVVKGNDPRDLNYDHYVVVGTFSKETNARNFSDRVAKETGADAKIGYNSIKQLYYIYIFKSAEYEPAREIYLKYRGSNQFGDIWILRIVKE